MPTARACRGRPEGPLQSAVTAAVWVGMIARVKGCRGKASADSRALHPPALGDGSALRSRLLARLAPVRDQSRRERSDLRDNADLHGRDHSTLRAFSYRCRHARAVGIKGSALSAGPTDRGGDHRRHARRRERPRWVGLRGVIVVLWRAGLRISEALALTERDLDPARGAVLVRRGKGGSDARSACTDGRSSNSTRGSRSAPASPSAHCSASFAARPVADRARRPASAASYGKSRARGRGSPPIRTPPICRPHCSADQTRRGAARRQISAPKHRHNPAPFPVPPSGGSDPARSSTETGLTSGCAPATQ